MAPGAQYPTTATCPSWRTWQPRDHATLLFVVREERVLLIRKKRGLGAGKINGPGGRLEPGETTPECALREVREELRTEATRPRRIGELSFQFVDGYGLHCTVYRADDCSPEPRETEEALPLWTPVDRIPYDEMWADDRLWFPHLLDETPFRGWFVFDDDEMLDHRLEVGPRRGEVEPRGSRAP